jgi:hypothetical protein
VEEATALLVLLVVSEEPSIPNTPITNLMATVEISTLLETMEDYVQKETLTLELALDILHS